MNHRVYVCERQLELCGPLTLLRAVRSVVRACTPTRDSISLRLDEWSHLLELLPANRKQRLELADVLPHL